METTERIARAMERYSKEFESKHPRDQDGMFAEKIESTAAMADGAFNPSWSVRKHGRMDCLMPVNHDSKPFVAELQRISSSLYDLDKDDPEQKFAIDIENRIGQAVHEFTFRNVHTEYGNEKSAFGVTGTGSATEVVKNAAACLIKAIKLYSHALPVIYFTAAERSRIGLYSLLSKRAEKVTGYIGYRVDLGNSDHALFALVDPSKATEFESVIRRQNAKVERYQKWDESKHVRDEVGKFANKSSSGSISESDKVAMPFDPFPKTFKEMKNRDYVDVWHGTTLQRLEKIIESGKTKTGERGQFLVSPRFRHASQYPEFPGEDEDPIVVSIRVPVSNLLPDENDQPGISLEQSLFGNHFGLAADVDGGIDISQIRGVYGESVDDAWTVAETGRHVAESILKNKSNRLDPVESARIDYAENGTKSKAFKAWFGDSKVVDSDGEPQETHGTAKPVYHGTPHDFEAFDSSTQDWSCEVGKGFYFTDNEELARSEYSKGGKVIAAYLKIDKPLDLDKPISDSDRDAIMEAGKKKFNHVDWNAPSGLTGDGIHRWIDNQLGTAFVNDVIEAAGFDGITHIARNKLGGRDKKKMDDFGRVWIAFAPSQVKSTDNRGTFDPKDNRMAYSKRIANAIEMYSFDPSQPRDKSGQWTAYDIGHKSGMNGFVSKRERQKALRENGHDIADSKVMQEFNRGHSDAISQKQNEREQAKNLRLAPFIEAARKNWKPGDFDIDDSDTQAWEAKLKSIAEEDADNADNEMDAENEKQQQINRDMKKHLVSEEVTSRARKIVGDWAKDHGWEVSNEHSSRTNSHYCTLAKRNGDEEESFTVRVSDHHAPHGSGFNEAKQEYHEPSDVNIVPELPPYDDESDWKEFDVKSGPDWSRFTVDTTELDKMARGDATDRQSYSKRIQSVLERYSKKPGEKKEHKFSSTQIDVPPEIAEKIRKLAERIPDNQLADDGRETDFHITALFGLHTNDPDDVKEVLYGQRPVTIVFGKTSIFSNADADVLKLEILGDGIRELNKRLKKGCEHTETHPTYQPHCTVAYLKPGKGHFWVGGEMFDQLKFDADEVQFSNKQREKTPIYLVSESKEIDGRIIRAKELYAKHKPAAGQSSFNWDESRVTRDDEGKFEHWNTGEVSASARPLIVDFERQNDRVEFKPPSQWTDSDKRKAKRLIAGAKAAMEDPHSTGPSLSHPIHTKESAEKAMWKALEVRNFGTAMSNRYDGDDGGLESLGRKMLQAAKDEMEYGYEKRQLATLKKPRQKTGFDRELEIMFAADNYSRAKQIVEIYGKKPAGGQRSMFDEEDHPRDPASGEFVEKDGGAAANAWKPENHVKIAADSIERLRGGDVYRLLDSSPPGNMNQMAEYIRKSRPDLAGHVQEATDDINEDRGTKPPEPKPMERVGVPGMQKNLFDEEPSGQKQLFDYIAPSKKDVKKAKQEDLLAGVNSRLKEQLKNKETLSPADLLTNVTHEPLAGQRDLFTKRFDIAKERFNRK